MRLNIVAGPWLCSIILHSRHCSWPFVSCSLLRSQNRTLSFSVVLICCRFSYQLRHWKPSAFSHVYRATVRLAFYLKPRTPFIVEKKRSLIGVHRNDNVLTDTRLNSEEECYFAENIWNFQQGNMRMNIRWHHSCRVCTPLHLVGGVGSLPAWMPKIFRSIRHPRLSPDRHLTNWIHHLLPARPPLEMSDQGFFFFFFYMPGPTQLSHEKNL